MPISSGYNQDDMFPNFVLTILKHSRHRKATKSICRPHFYLSIEKPVNNAGVLSVSSLANKRFRETIYLEKSQ
ncbi:hypothetical protein NC653_028828 [Populus alba x Populus x berolinensis]|uniref:Uncharacterized protein n=1 Tax=Populus alba x Populus x berolinensis TaxID=444605 RepID=A0AAD6Q2H2_9ROSI|nr:hypothetical protein NC653_028828 [Populus alba x Populus x berolinensis]